MNIDFPAKLAFLFRPARYKVLYGGRGGAKSWGIARTLLILGAQRKLRILCARELQLSIQDSVHKLLKEQIEALGLQGAYQVLQSVIRGHNGTEFIFSGLKSNITKVKSMEGVDIVWVEEAETVSEESWNVLIPTIRKAGSEIWVSFNPREETDPTFKRFVKDPPPDALVVKIGWQDNPWFPNELRREMEYLRRIDPEAAAHVWEGQTRKISNAQILRGRWSLEPFIPAANWEGPYYGVDWGFATDPVAFVRCWVETLPKVGDIEPRRLYIDHEAYGVGIEVDHTPKKFDDVPGGRIHTARADNARPETISYMKRHGYPMMEAVEKWPGSVEDGIEHLRSYEKIIIHPRCVHTAEEARLWSWKVDRLTGDILPVQVDKHNHCWDAVRYALAPVIKAIKVEYDYKAAPKVLDRKPQRDEVVSSFKAGFRRKAGGIL